jgi:hypothetical protein
MKEKSEPVTHEVCIDARKVDFVVRTIKSMTMNPNEAMGVLIAAYMKVCEESTQNQMTQLEMAVIAHKMIISMEDETIPSTSMH